MAQFEVLYPIEGLPQGRVRGGEIVELDEETAAPLVGVAALRPMPTSKQGGDPVSPAAQGDGPATDTGTDAKKAPAKSRGKK